MIRGIARQTGSLFSEADFLPLPCAHPNCHQLAYAFRSATGVIPRMVGELRDQESISQALTASEAGIQVLGTLHTRGATGTIDRIVNVFPEKQQELIRHMLADGLRMIVSQRLVPTADHSRRIPAVELLINTSAAATMIRTGQSHKLMTVIQSSRRAGMQSLDSSLKDLMQRKIITAESAYEHALDRTQFERYLVRSEAA